MTQAIAKKEAFKKRIQAIIDRYSSGEAEVVRAFFSRPRSKDEYLDIVLRQAGREVQVAHWAPFAGLRGEKLENGINRWDLSHYYHRLSDEIKHYALLADLADWLAGRKLSSEELRRYEVNAFWDPREDDRYLHNPLTPESGKMVDLSRELQATLDHDLLSSVKELSEGGGCGAFIEATSLKRDEFQRKFAVVMQKIAADEFHHGPGHLDEFVEEWIHSEADLEHCCRPVIAVMYQHLRLRNEIYNYPLNEARLAAIHRGESLTPLPPVPVELMAMIAAAK